MRKSNPPKDALAARRGARPGLSDVAAKLLADPGEWYEITDELPNAKDRSEQYLYEMARAISRGDRSAFRPKGQYEAVASTDGKRIWCKAVADFRPAATVTEDGSTDPGGVVEAEIVDGDPEF